MGVEVYACKELSSAGTCPGPSCQSKSEIFAEWSVANEQGWQDQTGGEEGTWTSSLKQERTGQAEPHESNCCTLPLS